MTKYASSLEIEILNAKDDILGRSTKDGMTEEL